MEALWKTLRKGSSWTGVDEVYENIEAPKFVDLAAPDFSCSDSRSWFCARIGCDESHEDVDPEEIHRNFVLRVMAARSPNVRFHKTLTRPHDPNLKCPKSAPAKNSKSRIGRLAETPSKLKNHKVAALISSTPSNTCQNAKTISKPKELLPKKEAAVKVSRTPKKSVKEPCSSAKKILTRIRDAPEEKEEFDENKENSNFTCGMVNRLANSCEPPRKKMAILNKNKSKSAQGAKVGVPRPTNPKPFRLRTEERGILREKNSERERKPTTPKPFRLRTEERMILREKNLEREKKPDSDEKMKTPVPREERESVKKKKNMERERKANVDEKIEAGVLKEERESEKKKRPGATICSSASKKALTVPRGPTFTKVNVPHRCVKRFDQEN